MNFIETVAAAVSALIALPVTGLAQNGAVEIDLSKMVPAAAPYNTTPPLPGMPVMPAQAPVQAVYNPAPPVKPVAKKTSGCLSVLVGALGLAPLLWIVVAVTSH